MSGIGFVGAGASSDLRYVSGEYYQPDGILAPSSGSPAATGVIRLTPGFIRAPVTISKLLVRLTTLAAGGNAQLGLYACDPVTGKPTGAPLFTSPSLSTAATGILEASPSLALQKGLYALGVNVDASGAAAVFSAPWAGSCGFQMIAGRTVNTALLLASGLNTGWQKANAFNNWPPLTGNLATDSITETNAVTPLWGFKVA